MFKRVAFTMYAVTDMPRARKFYEEILGLKSTVEYQEGKWVEYDLAEGGCLAITNMVPDFSPSANSGGSIALEVEDIDKLMASLKEKNVQVQMDTFDSPVCRMSVILDSEGKFINVASVSRKKINLKYRVPFMLKIICFFLASFYLSTGFAAQSKNAFWLGTFSKKEITENYFGWIEAQLRYNNDEGRTNQILYRTGLLYKWTEKSEFGFLYGFIQSGNQREHRYTLQHVQKYGDLLSLDVSHRIRFEGRFLEGSSDESARLRVLVRAEGETRPGPSLVLWNEAFLNTTRDSWTGDRTFERNRFFLGFKMKIFNSKTELGYMNQYVPRASGNTSEHIITVYWFL